MTTSAGIVAPIAAVTPGTHAEAARARDGRGVAGAFTRERLGVLAHQGVLQHDRATTLKTWTVAETISASRGWVSHCLLSLVVGCARGIAALRSSAVWAWIDVTATLDPTRTPVFQGDASDEVRFLKDMRKGDKLTLSVYSLGAHSGTHIDAPMHF